MAFAAILVGVELKVGIVPLDLMEPLDANDSAVIHVVELGVVLLVLQGVVHQAYLA